MSPDVSYHISLRREGDKIYFLINLIECGYWTTEDFARMRVFGEGFWRAEFEEIIMPRLIPPDPRCGNCDKRGYVITDRNVAYGTPLCDKCYRAISDANRERLERHISGEVDDDD